MGKDRIRLKASHPEAPVELSGAIGPIRFPEESNSPILASMEQLTLAVTSGRELSEKEIAEFRNLQTQLRYDARVKRARLTQRLYDILNYALDRYETLVMEGKDLDIPISQLRLLMGMFLDQTREEFGDKQAETVIDQRQQSMQITIVEAVKDYGKNGKVSETIIDG